MRLKGHPVFAHLAQAGQAHHLKPAAIGQNWTLPIHKLMQTAQPINPLCRRAQHQMISIAKQYIRPSLPHRAWQHRLDRGRRSNGHESRRSDLAARGVNGASPSLA